MSENIERALVDMKCPSQLQAQQILHLNCISIFPVVQWLVCQRSKFSKKILGPNLTPQVNHLIDVRKATGDLVRLSSVKQFDNFSYKLPADEEKEQNIPKGMAYLADCTNHYSAKRTHRIKNSVSKNLKSKLRNSELSIFKD